MRVVVQTAFAKCFQTSRLKPNVNPIVISNTIWQTNVLQHFEQ